MAKKGYVTKSFMFDDQRYWVYGKDEEDAILKKHEKLRELETGQITSNTTVRQWAKVWLETYIKPSDITKGSYRMYPDTLDKVILPAIGSVPLRKVTPTQLQQILNKRKDMSFSHANKLKLVLQRMFRQARDDRIIPFDPSTGLKLPKTKKGKHRSLTEAERAALLTVAEMKDFGGKKNLSGAWVLSMLYCGLRPGETPALKWDDIDLDEKKPVMHIHEAKEAHGKDFKAPKTDAGTRDIPIPKEYLPWLQALPRTSAYVFPQRDGKTPLTDTSIRRRWETIKKYMDLELGAKHEYVKPQGKRKRVLVITEHALADDLDLYDLRHTYCTDLEKKKVPINVAKVLMGHSDISVTANIYTHSDEATVEMARGLIDA